VVVRLTDVVCDGPEDKKWASKGVRVWMSVVPCTCRLDEDVGNAENAANMKSRRIGTEDDANGAKKEKGETVGKMRVEGLILDTPTIQSVDYYMIQCCMGMKRGCPILGREH
jgi:hypothetical protein